MSSESNEPSVSDRVFLTYDEALARLPDGDVIHTFTNPCVGLIIGANWSRAGVLKALKAEGAVIEESGPRAMEANHGIAVKYDGETIFIATKKA